MHVLAISNASAQESEVFQVVANILTSRGHEISVFKQDKCLEGETLLTRVKKGIPSYHVLIEGEEFNLNSFDAFWYMHPMLPRELILYPKIEYRQFIHNQFFAMRKTIWSLFRHKKWINDPWNIFQLEDKLYQMSIAHQVGFSIPDTVITSEPEVVRDFYHEHTGNVIVKNLATSPIMDRVIATNRLTAEALEKIDSVRLAPSIFQEYIEKKYELRITVVGEKIFASKIHSQEDEATALDWRVKPKNSNSVVRMESTEIPTVLRNQIKKFMDFSGLQFGCLDFIVTPENRYVFLEINPNGQWHFVQINTGVQIADAIADILTS